MDFNKAPTKIDDRTDSGDERLPICDPTHKV
jgi:hypothetical protein